MRVLELFSGIGGVTEALGVPACLAVDHDEAAADTYRAIHSESVLRKNLHYVKPGWFEPYRDCMWWMSPPCQPYTIRGQQRDLDDPRSAAFQRVTEAVGVLCPPMLVVENVPWFAGSRGEALLVSTLEERGYAWHAEVMCPTDLGLRAERRRYYLVASRSELQQPRRPRVRPSRIQDWIGPQNEDYLVPDHLLERFEDALHVVDADDPEAIAACFTGAYGRSPVYAGSYLRQNGRIRWFTPYEVARSLGWERRIAFPTTVSRAKQYKLVGNSLSLPAVRYQISRLGVEPRER